MGKRSANKTRKPDDEDLDDQDEGADDDDGDEGDEGEGEGEGTPPPATTAAAAAAVAPVARAEVPPWVAWARRYWRFIQSRDPEVVNATVDNHEKLAAWLTDRGRYAVNKMHSLTSRGTSIKDAERVVLDEIIEPVSRGDPEPLSPAIAETLPQRIARFEQSSEGQIFAAW